MCMRYQTDNKYRKFVQGYGFLSFAKKFENKYGKKLIDTKKSSNSKYGKRINDTTKKKRGINFGKIAGKKMVEKSTEATGDLIGNKIADKITSLGSKNDKKESEINDQSEEIIISEEKRQKLLMI